eukprot:scaffold8293_cov123-Isochrysis_galbana.AAC.5
MFNLRFDTTSARLAPASPRAAVHLWPPPSHRLGPPARHTARPSPSPYSLPARSGDGGRPASLSLPSRLPAPFTLPFPNRILTYE